MRTFVIVARMLVEADSPRAALAEACEAIDCASPFLLDFEVDDAAREVAVEVHQIEQRAGYIADLSIRH